VLCLNQSLICQGSPQVALAPEVLSRVYGPVRDSGAEHHFVRYHRH